MSMPPENFVSHRTRRSFKQAQETLEAGKFEQTRDHAERCVSEAPDIEDGWFMLSEAYVGLGMNQEGLDLVNRGLKKWPDKYHFHVQNCKFLICLDRFPEALVCAQETVAKGVPDLWSILALARVFTILDEVQQALPLYLQACEMQPANPGYWLNLATTERSCGQLDSAREHVEKALALQPEFPSALLVLSSLRKATENDNSITLLKSLQQGDQWSSIDRTNIGYALGKEFEDLEQWQNAFEALSQGGAAGRREMPYQRQNSVDLVESLIRHYADARVIAGDVGFETEEPIFIVGMPRTGTTIVESILGAHSDVFAAGELRQFALAIGGALEAGRGPLFGPSQIEQSLQIDFRALGETYINSTRPRTGQTRFFTDKRLLNFLYLGLIAKALPKARIIHLKRNPMDTVWSNFKQMFGDTYAYSYDLADTAHFFVLYHQLMEHWMKLMPEHILEVEYEKLVDNQEAETRRILEYCDLQWQQECLDFHTNRDSVTTASSVQVRQPIYRSALQRWRKFEPFLGEAKQILTDAGIGF
jgi:tetratricopeptide (TPR) repeat protein